MGLEIKLCLVIILGFFLLSITTTITLLDICVLSTLNSSDRRVSVF